jgi:hypothetical protein
MRTTKIINQEKRRQELASKGLCIVCRTNPAKNDILSCEECATKRANYFKKFREKRIKKDICIDCGKNPPIEGRKKCQLCVERTKRVSNKRRKERRESGVCSECGKPSEKYTRCKPCREVARLCSQKRIQALYDSGACRFCKKPRIESHTLCESCYLGTLAHELWKDRSRWAELKTLFDAQQGLCKYTGEPICIGKNASVDHKIPRGKGGTNDLKNLQWVHEEINTMKWDMLEETFLNRAKQIINFMEKKHD